MASHQAQKRRVEEASSYVAAGNILVVIKQPDPNSHTFSMPYKPSDADNSLTTQFHHWLLEGENNVDYLLGSGSLFTYRKESEEEELETVTLPGPVPVWAFQVKQLLPEGTGKLRFTTSESFYEAIMEIGADTVARLIGDDFHFLFLCDMYRIGENGTQGYRLMLDFIATRLVASQVCVYPPLSLVYFLTDKHNLRDPPLAHLMLPSVMVPAQSTLGKTATVAVQQLMKKFPGHALNFQDSLVAKVGRSGSGLGVFFLDRIAGVTNQNVWVTKRSGVAIPDKTQDKTTGLKIGQLLKFEPFVVDLAKQEWRFFSYLPNHVTDKGLSNIYAVRTAMKPSDGLLRIDKIPGIYLQGNQGRILTKPVVKKMRQLFKSALDALVETQKPSWRGIRFLVFRFDCFVCQVDGNIYLNEIDLFPMAHALMDDYISCEDYIKTMAKCTRDYLIEHSCSNTSWSM
jgi:hypothetical protein